MLDIILTIILLISPIFTIVYCKRTILEYRRMTDYLKNSLYSISDNVDVIHQLLLEYSTFDDDVQSDIALEDTKENEV